MLYTWNYYNIVNQLHFSKKNKFRLLLSPLAKKVEQTVHYSFSSVLPLSLTAIISFMVIYYLQLCLSYCTERFLKVKRMSYLSMNLQYIP